MSVETYKRAKEIFSENKSKFTAFEVQLVEMLAGEKNHEEYCSIFCDLLDLLKHKHFKKYVYNKKDVPEEAQRIINWYEDMEAQLKEWERKQKEEANLK